MIYVIPRIGYRVLCGGGRPHHHWWCNITHTGVYYYLTSYCFGNTMHTHCFQNDTVLATNLIRPFDAYDYHANHINDLRLSFF